MKVAIANDHAGYPLKLAVMEHLRELGHDVDDLGTYSEDPVDYPPFCAACARHVVAGRAEIGIVIGGSGQGEQISANKVHGARAALCHDEYTARLARQHNNANILALGARILATVLACDIVDMFLSSEFQGGRHQHRIDEISAIEVDESKAWAAAQGPANPEPSAVRAAGLPRRPGEVGRLRAGPGVGPAGHALAQCGRHFFASGQPVGQGRAALPRRRQWSGRRCRRGRGLGRVPGPARAHL